MNITGRTIQLGVIGNPVSHSISPRLHNTMIEKMNLDYTYSAFRVTEGEAGKAIDGMRALNIRGFNVTIPHKIKAFELCDEVDPFAEKMGACNTLVNTNGVIKGYNTDGAGFIRSLEYKGIDVKGKAVVVIGAGGAAQGVAMALADAGTEKIGIINRTKEKAEKLAERINTYYPDLACCYEGDFKADIIVNTTSVGMNSDETPTDNLDMLKKEAVVCDIVYCPRETAFLKMAREAGFKTVGGIGMLINQAVIAFELFTGNEVSKETVDYLYRMTELEESIVLTGFMGTGKTTVAKRLCALTGAEFIDTDEIIEKETGMEIKDIFAAFGEEHFRNKESEVIKRLKNKKGAVISLGGGAVIRRENIDLLRENNMVFCLEADIDKVFENIGGNTASRPLLSGKTKEEAKALLDSRREAYKNCDFTVDVTNLERGQAADIILELYMGRD
ncbi:MAG: shikimate dehydrogenase [Clostridia bacterium]|nr:shikimate dehydrogenase [Clostridia bacterium]